jgi:hypothetical protein
MLKNGEIDLISSQAHQRGLNKVVISIYPEQRLKVLAERPMETV